MVHLFSEEEKRQLMGLIQSAQKVHVMAIEKVDIEELPQIPKDHPEYYYGVQRIRACTAFKSRWPYDPAFSYDLKFLISSTLDAIYEAQQNEETAVVLNNMCCTDNGRCPQMDFRRLFIVELKNSQ